MAALDFSTMKTKVALRLGNTQSSDPFYSYMGPWVNDAANRVILRALSRNSKHKEGLFPELQEKSRTDATTNGVEYISKPTDCLWINSVFSFDISSAADESTDPRYVMAEVPSQRYVGVARPHHVHDGVSEALAALRQPNPGASGAHDGVLVQVAGAGVREGNGP